MQKQEVIFLHSHTFHAPVKSNAIALLTGCWDQEDQKGVYSCPQCRDTFTPRPVLRRNTMLTDVIEKLKKTKLQSDAKAPSYAGPGDVECDFCTGRKHKATKSCLTCMGSYCEVHIQPHYEVPRFSKHKLVNATSQLQEKICSQHDKIIEIFCRLDQKLICLQCSMDNHNGHETVSAVAERTEKQNKLAEIKVENQTQIQQREKELQEVNQALQTLKASAQAAVEDAERMFTELISFMEQKRSEVTEPIRAQERAESFDACYTSPVSKIRSSIIFTPHLSSTDIKRPALKEIEQMVLRLNSDNESTSHQPSEITHPHPKCVVPEREFRLGDRVRVKASVENPKENWTLRQSQ
ncbi:E3 ubiquitin/ISG15 ligase TRIM25-like isoform X2 [Alosa pseudoharengus]|uniref:E3 ubiquitin/ISG15 ligase TRIM25-like isoform X2 n=1 Tax=Alosa pseudoharengus TaxID=34774 RepID=UPI003F8949D3